MSDPPPVYREFRDTDGTDWRVWEVVPADSRALAERRRDPPEDATVSEAIAHRRAIQNERRTRWTQGWLLFEGAGASRRLMPIPAGWQAASVGELQSYCQQATPVTRRMRNEPKA